MGNNYIIPKEEENLQQKLVFKQNLGNSDTNEMIKLNLKIYQITTNNLLKNMKAFRKQQQ